MRSHAGPLSARRIRLPSVKLQPNRVTAGLGPVFLTGRGPVFLTARSPGPLKATAASPWPR
jgi:hypothetical protein